MFYQVFYHVFYKLLFFSQIISHPFVQIWLIDFHCPKKDRLDFGNLYSIEKLVSIGINKQLDE